MKIKYISEQKLLQYKNSLGSIKSPEKRATVGVLLDRLLGELEELEEYEDDGDAKVS